MLPDIRDTGLLWQAPLRKSGYFIYYLVILLFLSGFISLFFIEVPVSVRSPGIFRPTNEGAEIQAIVAGISDSLSYPAGPDSRLIAECYISARDIGMLRIGQRVQIQVDAFDDHYFGTVSGWIYTIGDDFIFSGKTPVFKVRCRIDQQQMEPPVRVKRKLKMGMRFHARFITGSQTLWRLLYDKMYRWSDPTRTPS